MSKKEVKSIFGNKKLQPIKEELSAPPDKKDYLNDFFERDYPSKDAEEQKNIEEAIIEDVKAYKSYYATTSAHETFRDIVYTLRQKVDADFNNGEVFEQMLQHYVKHITEQHGPLMRAKAPKKGRR
jgi:hypothetical protein